MTTLKVKNNGLYIPPSMWFAAVGSNTYQISLDNIADGYVIISNSDDYTNYQTNLLTYARQFYTNGEEAAITFETI